MKVHDVMIEVETEINRQLRLINIDPEQDITDPVMRDHAEYKMLMAFPRIINRMHGITARAHGVPSSMADVAEVVAVAMSDDVEVVRNVSYRGQMVKQR